MGTGVHQLNEEMSEEIPILLALKILPNAVIGRN